MKKRTIKRTYLYTNNDFLYRQFGLEDNERDIFIITKENIECFKDYIEELKKYNIDETNEKIKELLSVVEKELENVDEVQVVME
jgi:DNA-binding transcriptional regulator GbsR (MarR family)